MTDIARLVYQFDTSDAAKAHTDLDRLEKKSESTGAAADRLGERAKRTGQKFRETSGDLKYLLTGLTELAKVAAGAFIGVAGWEGLKALARGLLDAQVQLDRLRMLFTTTTGSAAGAAKEMDYVRGVAHKLGLEINTTAIAYAKLSAASQGTKLAGQGAKDIFESVAGAAAKLGLSADETNAALYAIGQMMSKGQVMAEELRGQLGERLPGAFQIAARAMGVTTMELGKMLEQGQVISEDFLPKFAAELRRTYGGEEMHTAQAEINRLSTAWSLFVQAVADSGAGDLIVTALKKMADGLRSATTVVEEWRRFGEMTGDAWLQGFFGKAGMVARLLLPGVAGKAAGMGFDLFSAAATPLQGVEAQLDANNELAASYDDLTKATQEYLDSISGAAGPSKAYVELTQRLAGVSKDFQTKLAVLNAEFERQGGAADPENLRRYRAEVAELIRAETDLGKATVRAHADAAKAAAALRKERRELFESAINATREEAALLGATTEEEKALWEVQSGRYAELEQWQKDVIVAEAQSLDALRQRVDYENKLREATAAAERQRVDGALAELDAADKLVRSLERELVVAKASVEATRQYEAAQIDAAIATAKSSLAIAEKTSRSAAEIEAIKETIAQLEKAKRLQQEVYRTEDAVQAGANARRVADETRAAWEDAAAEIRESLTDALMRGFESGKSAARNLRDTVVNMFRTMILRPIVQGVLAPVAGMFAGPASAATGILGGGGSLFSASPLGGIGGSLLSSLGGGIASLSGGAGGFFGGLGGGITNIAAEGLLAGTLSNFSGGFAALGAGNILGGLGSLAAGALPIVGIGLAIASALGAFERGGPKTGGAASSLADVMGGSVGLGSLERLFTPDQKDADVQKVTDAIARSFLDYARALGIKTGSAQFGLGFDTDPEGDAGNRVSALATLNGQTVYQRTDLDLGRDGDVTAALELEAKRALFAALKASDMPEYLADLFSGLDATTATAEEIEAILATASALRVAVDAVTGLGDQFAAMDPSVVREFVESFGGLEGFMERFAFIAENFYTDAQKTERATQQLNAAFAALGQEVPATHQAFLDLINGLDLTVQADRELYEALTALAPLFVRVRGTAQDAADALDDAADSLDEIAEAAANIIDLGSLTGTVYGEANAAIARIVDLAAQLSENIGQRLARQMTLANGEIQRYIALWQQAAPGSAESQALLEIIGILQQFNQQTAAELALYNSIVAQYGAAHADAIFELQQFYWQQQQLFQGNTEALAALAVWYNEQLQAILNGVSEGVTGTVSELQRLRDSLKEYIRSLRTSDLSPASPADKLAEAQRQYLDLLSRAQAGDLDALRELQQAADTYLTLAQQFYASSGNYVSIFESVVSALEALANRETGGTEPKPSEAALMDALPTDSKLASAADLERAADRIAAAVVAAVQRQSQTIARATERIVAGSQESLK